MEERVGAVVHGEGVWAEDRPEAATWLRARGPCSLVNDGSFAVWFVTASPSSVANGRIQFLVHGLLLPVPVPALLSSGTQRLTKGRVYGECLGHPYTNHNHPCIKKCR